MCIWYLGVKRMLKFLIAAPVVLMDSACFCCSNLKLISSLAFLYYFNAENINF